MVENKVDDNEEGPRPVNGKSMYSYISDAWDRPDASYVKGLMWERLIIWRREPNFLRLESPTRLDRARAPSATRPSRASSSSAATSARAACRSALGTRGGAPSARV
jgi:hypothetical protein